MVILLLHSHYIFVASLCITSLTSLYPVVFFRSLLLPISYYNQAALTALDSVCNCLIVLEYAVVCVISAIAMNIKLKQQFIHNVSGNFSLFNSATVCHLRNLKYWIFWLMQSKFRQNHSVRCRHIAIFRFFKMMTVCNPWFLNFECFCIPYCPYDKRSSAYQI